MRLLESRSLPVPLARAWAALDDLALLQRAIPGCETIAPTGPEAWDATIALSVGPLPARVVVHLVRVDVRAPRACTIRFEAATLAGAARGEARLRLAADGRAAATLQAAIQAAVDGPVAQFGTAFIDAAAQHLAAEFFDRFVATLGERQAERSA